MLGGSRGTTTNKQTNKTKNTTTYLFLQPRARSRVPDVVGHLVASKAVEVLLLYPVGVLAIERLPAELLEPRSPQDVESLARPIDAMALPFREVDLVDAAPHHDSHVPVLLHEGLGRAVMPVGLMPPSGAWTPTRRPRACPRAARGRVVIRRLLARVIGIRHPRPRGVALIMHITV